MTLPPFQKRVANFVQTRHLEIEVRDRMLDLTSEVGELAKEVLKASSYGRQDFHPNDAWSNELGDVLFSLICLANSTDIDLIEALDTALEKYQARFDWSGDTGSETM